MLGLLATVVSTTRATVDVLEQIRIECVFCCGWFVTLGGHVTLADLEAYVSSFKDPVHVTLSNGDYTIYNPPPPSSGVVLDFILGILDGK